MDGLFVIAGGFHYIQFQPDRNYHDANDQDVRYCPSENLATDFDQPFNGILPAFQDISRIDIEG